MAEIIYTAGLAAATAVAQVDTFTPANVEVGDTFTLTATGDDGTTAAVSFVATAATVANATAGLVAAWNASTHRLHTPITATDQTTSLKLTADTAGVPFSVAATTTDGGGTNTQTLTRAATTASVGGSDAGLAGNYYGNALPASSGDNLTIDGRNAAAVAYGKNLSAKTFTLVRIYKSNGYNVGLAPSSSNPTAEYFRASATTWRYGDPPQDGTNPTGPQFVAWDFGTNTHTAYVLDSANSGINGLPVVNLKGVNASNVLHVVGGYAGVATLNAGDAATYGTINVDGGKCTLASGTTVTTVNQNGGDLWMYCGATTVKQDSGSLKTFGSGAITSLYAGGKAELRSTGKVTTLEIPGSGDVTFENLSATAASPVTIADTIVLHKGAKLNLDNGVPGSLLVTNPIQLYRCDLQEVTIKLPKHMSLTLAAL